MGVQSYGDKEICSFEYISIQPLCKVLNPNLPALALTREKMKGQECLGQIWIDVQGPPIDFPILQYQSFYVFRISCDKIHQFGRSREHQETKVFACPGIAACFRNGPRDPATKTYWHNAMPLCHLQEKTCRARTQWRTGKNFSLVHLFSWDHVTHFS